MSRAGAFLDKLRRAAGEIENHVVDEFLAGRLDRRHQHFLGTRRVLLLPHDLRDVAQDSQPGGQPGVYPGRGLADQPRPQHQPVRRDLRLGGSLLEGRQQAVRRRMGRFPAITGRRTLLARVGAG